MERGVWAPEFDSGRQLVVGGGGTDNRGARPG
jgi:hypothetical protein